MTSIFPLPTGYLNVKEPGDVVQRSIPLVGSQSTILTTATLAASPSGAGELVLSNLTVSYTTAAFVVSGGVPGRVYTLEAIATDNAGNTYEVLAFQPIDGVLVVDPPVVPPLQGFGTPLTWHA